MFLLLVVASCNRENKEKEQLKVRIADFQDQRLTDSLKVYLKSKDAATKKAAALAMGSVQDTTAIKDLAAVLDEQVVEAAFALGQMYDRKAMKPLLPHTHDKDPVLVREVYEALGKVMSKETLFAFQEPTTDTTVLAGIAWGIYRAGVRSVSDSTTANIALSILLNKKAGHNARLGAAQYFSRASFRPNEKIAEGLSSIINDEDAEVRMSAVNALVKVKEELGLPAITKAVTDTDYRVRVNAARALRTQSWDVAKPWFEKLLGDDNVNVTIATAEVISNIAPIKDTTALNNWATAAENWRTQATLLDAYVKLRGSSVRARDLVINSKNDYQKAALLTVLSNDASNADFIFDQYKNSDVKVIKSTAATALARTNRNNQKRSAQYIQWYQEIIADGDQGSLIPVCAALQDSTLGYKKSLSDLSFLEQAKSRLSLPRDYETFVPLEKTLNYLKGLPPPPPIENKYNHPIDWTVAASIAKDQHVMIETSKGEIVMRLFVDEAPGSVVNFVNLVNTGYFNDRFFHRVVPNFVIQTGCNRGDGYGSEDYSIRSEFSQRKYKTGSVGMASAGKDTEGTQWFITHSPTPHLDGKYTIFAEVVKGMDVVHQIEVGDKIISARLIEY